MTPAIPGGDEETRRTMMDIDTGGPVETPMETHITIVKALLRCGGRMTIDSLPGDASLAAYNIPADVQTALANALDLLAKRDAELARVARERDEWRDVVSWLDNGEKTIFDWCTGGGHPEGEFSHIGLRREMPDGQVLFRAYTADEPWKPASLTPEPEGEKP